SSPELKSQRIEALTEWTKNKKGILIAPVAALKRILPPQSYWEKYELAFINGEEINIDEYLLSLVEMGYGHTTMVTAPGEFSRRGGIIDIYPLTEEHPIRIELFDEEVDSIRFFDADTQRSIEPLKEITVGPATEILLTKEDMITSSGRIEKALAESLKNMSESEQKERLIEVIDYDIERLKNLERFEEMYKYIGFFYDKPASLLDYLPGNGLIVLDDMSRIQEVATNLDGEEAEWFTSLLESNQIVKNSQISFDWQTIWDSIDQQRLYLSIFLRHIPNTQPENIINLSSRDM